MCIQVIARGYSVFAARHPTCIPPQQADLVAFIRAVAHDWGEESLRETRRRTIPSERREAPGGASTTRKPATGLPASYSSPSEQGCGLEPQSHSSSS
jgi:hypothetical protein